MQERAKPFFFPGSPKSGNGRTGSYCAKQRGIRYPPSDRSSHPRTSTSISFAKSSNAAFGPVQGRWGPCREEIQAALPWKRPRVNRDDPSGSSRRGTRIGPQRCAVTGDYGQRPGAPSPGGPCEEIHPDLTAPTASWRKGRGGPSRRCNPARPPPTHLTLRLCAIAI